MEAHRKLWGWRCNSVIQHFSPIHWFHWHGKKQRSFRVGIKFMTESVPDIKIISIRHYHYAHFESTFKMKGRLRLSLHPLLANEGVSESSSSDYETLLCRPCSLDLRTVSVTCYSDFKEEGKGTRNQSGKREGDQGAPKAAQGGS